MSRDLLAQHTHKQTNIFFAVRFGFVFPFNFPSPVLLFIFCHSVKFIKFSLFCLINLLRRCPNVRAFMCVQHTNMLQLLLSLLWCWILWGFVVAVVVVVRLCSVLTLDTYDNVNLVTLACNCYCRWCLIVVVTRHKIFAYNEGCGKELEWGEKFCFKNHNLLTWTFRSIKPFVGDRWKIWPLEKNCSYKTLKNILLLIRLPRISDFLPKIKIMLKDSLRFLSKKIYFLLKTSWGNIKLGRTTYFIALSTMVIYKKKKE